MAGIGHRGFMGRKAGYVCTPYGTPLPYSTNLISHTSIYNICDLFQLNDETLPFIDLTPPDAEDKPIAYIVDQSGLGNDAYDASTPPTSVRSFRYKTDAGIYGDAPSALVSGTGYGIQNAWRWNNEVKTGIFLIQVDDVTSNASTRIQQNQFQIRFVSSNLSVFDGANRNTTLTGTSSTWMIVSCRTNNNIILGLNKSYQTAKATAPTVANVDFAPFLTPSSANKFLGKFREMIFFSESISDANLDDISDWLTTKWNL